MPFVISDDLVVNTTLEGTQFNAVTAALQNGDYLVTFLDSSQGTSVIKGKIITPFGAAAGEEFLLEFNAGHTIPVAATALSGDHFLVLWEEDSASSLTTLVARIFNHDGSPASETITIATSSMYFGYSTIKACPKADGGFTVEWYGIDENFGDLLPHTRSFDSFGSPKGDAELLHYNIGSSIAVGQNTTSSALKLIAWSAPSNDWAVDYFDLYGQIVDQDGNAVSPKFTINSSHYTVERNDKVHALANGDWLVSWTSESNNFLDPYTINARIYDKTGAAKSPAIELATFDRPTHDYFYQLDELPDGRFVLFYISENLSGTTLNAMVYLRDGTACGDFISIYAGQLGLQVKPSVTTLANDCFAWTWTYNDSWTTADTNVHTSVIKLTQFDGTAADDKWIGGSFAEVLLGRGGGDDLRGGGGKDTVDGGSGNDHLSGGSGADIIKGGTGDDLINGGAGKDTINGGAGHDTYIYRFVDQGGDSLAQFSNIDDFCFEGSTFGYGTYSGAINAADFLSRSSGHSARDSGDHFIFDRKLDQLWFDADGSGSKKAVLIADIVADANVTAADILIL